jgi:hypothetical protein
MKSRKAIIETTNSLQEDFVKSILKRASSTKKSRKVNRTSRSGKKSRVRFSRKNQVQYFMKK